MASSRVRACPRVVEVGDLDKEAATEDAEGAGEEADIRSFILERFVHGEVQTPF